MRNFFKIIGLLVLIALTVTACDVKKQLDQLLNLARCQYQLGTFSDVHVSGVAVEGKSALELATSAFTIGQDLAAGNVPVSMNLNLNVHNPQKDTAAFSQVDYTMALDGKQLTQGSVNKRFSVGPGGISPLPIGVTFNLLDATSENTLSSLYNFIVNLVAPSQASKPTRIGLRIRPSFVVAGQTVKFPNYFTVNTELRNDSL